MKIASWPAVALFMVLICNKSGAKIEFKENNNTP
jgi:hypothetical protein